MFELPLKLAVLAAVAWLIWRLLQPNTDVVIEIVEGSARLKHGKLTASQLADLTTICRDAGISQGRISGVLRKHRGWRLHFSREFTAGVQQQIRNTLAATR